MEVEKRVEEIKPLEVIRAEQMLEKIEEKNKSPLGDLVGGFFAILIAMTTLNIALESMSKAFKDDNIKIDKKRDDKDEKTTSN
jgi:hypothetical protein